MKTSRSVLAAIVIVGLICAAVFAAATRERGKSRSELAQRIAFQGPSEENIEGIRASIALYQKKIERHVQDAAKTANYWKILAVRLQDRGLRGDALEALEHAIFYSPEDPALHCAAGISAGIIAKSVHAFPGSENIDRQRYYDLAEEAFLRAIELDGRYLRPRYSLAVLYVFDLDRPGEAVPHLERSLEISRNDVDTMFVLARAFYMTQNYQAAVELYDRIITLTRDEQKRIDAQNNRQLALGRMHG